MKIKIELTAQELDYIANVLMDRPHREVAALLQNLRVQVESQQRPTPQGYDNIHELVTPKEA